MILWTIQNFKRWEILQRDGIIRSNPASVDSYFLYQYCWLAEVMIKKIGNPPVDKMLPLWAWYKCYGLKKKPDLRSRGYIGKGEKGVRIEFEIDKSKVLLSDFDLWHYVLNNFYIPKNEADDLNFDKYIQRKGISGFEQKTKSDKEAQKKIESSWNRIFDLKWVDNKGYITHSLEKKSIQATFWELHLNQVKDVKVFHER